MIKKYHSKKYLIEKLKTCNYIQIAKKNNVDTSTIQRYLRRHGLTKKRISWTKEELTALKENYETDPQVYRLFPKRTISGVNHKASRRGLIKQVKKRKHSVNHDFFKTWTPEMAYVLGFFFSDGNVSFDRKQISIHLNKQDYHILEKISKVMESEIAIRVYPHSSYLRINSKILAKDLIELGCVPRKSKILRFPEINDDFLNHFVRGYFDGDGSITFNKPNTIKIHLIGTQEFLEEMRNRIANLIEIKRNPIVKNREIWRFSLYGNCARKFCIWMYQNSKDLYLERKRNRFIRHMKLRENGI